MVKMLLVGAEPGNHALTEQLLEKQVDWSVAYAESGRQALAILERDAVDLVLTDLQIPEINGLELISEIRSQYPSVPVILMTAHDSADIARAPLRCGTASHVSKQNRPHELAGTVGTLLSITTAQRDAQRLLECLMRTEAQFLLDNNPSLIPPLVGQLRENLVRIGLCDEIGLIRVTIALSEALTSAMVQGNLEIDPELREHDEQALWRQIEGRRGQKPYRERRVHVLAKELLLEARYVIRHEGPGFDPADLPHSVDPANRKVGIGGLSLVRTFLDEVTLNQAGNEITLVKRRDR
jgi:CheY-like chemotaxis protein